MTLGEGAGNPGVPEAVVPHLSRSSISLTPFVLAHGRSDPRWQTRVRLAWSDAGLHVDFLCEDDDVWGSYRERDEPLWEEEAVEVFLAPGPDPPVRYFEFQFNPFGAVFDARVDNPHGDRASMRVRSDWDCRGLRSHARVEAGERRWHVRALLPWNGLGVDSGPPLDWRANFFRIERPREAPHEFSAWSPPLTDPPDFHRPARFGRLRLAPGTKGEACPTGR
jgi:hypothetical protein